MAQGTASLWKDVLSSPANLPLCNQEGVHEFFVFHVMSGQGDQQLRKVTDAHEVRALSGHLAHHFQNDCLTFLKLHKWVISYSSFKYTRCPRDAKAVEMTPTLWSHRDKTVSQEYTDWFMDQSNKPRVILT